MLDRRRFLHGLAATALLPLASRADAVDPILTRTIPAGGEHLPAIGMGSYISFDVGGFRDARERRAVVLQTFFERGGALIDSSPMYGSAEDVIGWCLPRVRGRAALFSATKVWTPGRAMGIAQMEKSRELWGVERFDLMQVHNLLDWETHLDTLRGWKAEGRVRHVGVTTSHGRRHDELERIMRSQPVDFVQFTYNIADREAERRLLPLAAERGIAVIVNRPFRRGGLFHAVRGHALPDWAAEIDCRSWAQFFLKFIVAHPAVTCAIPATSNPEHMLQNMDAMRGPQPDAAMRRRMADHFAAL